VEISPNLAAWLALPRREYNEKIIPKNWKRKNQATRRAAGISNRPDVCRHSFASYHLVEHENVDRLKMQLGHSRVSDTLFAHYRAAVSKAAAREYWSICPPGVSIGYKNRRARGGVNRTA
jgi:integrase